MILADVIELVSIAYKSDSIGNQMPVESKRKVFCNVKSASQSEFFKGGEQGLKPEFKFTLFRYDYNGEPEIEYNGARYAVYRTYAGDDDNMELYVTRKVGV